jgi:SAM-dependent methyltransferase
MNWNQRMREDWDRRARQDAEKFIYTRDSASDAADFAHSGRANYNQLVRPYLPLLLRGQPARDCRVVEIGCGIGRITQWLAADFGEVAALDVSPVMIQTARERLAHLPNIRFHVGTGSDLAPVPDASADLVFSYIVFQHIPSREAIEAYIVDAARVLKSGGACKFQVNGDQSPAYLAHQRDTWLGEVFSEGDIAGMLDRAGLTSISSEGAGTQYYVITAIKGEPPARSYVLPGEPWAEQFLLQGFGPAVDDSWRPMAGEAKVRVEGPGSRLYLGLYFWPESCHHQLSLAGHTFTIETAGDHYLECPGTPGEIEIRLDPVPTKHPAFRIVGLY